MLFSKQNKHSWYEHMLHVFRCKASILFFICLLTRLCFVGRYLDSCDSIDFAFGLLDYDLSLLQPHFPGYPVYMFVSWLCFKLFHHEVWALVMPGVLFGSLTVYPLYWLAKQLFSERVAVLTVVFYLINPLCWLQAERPTSDAMGLFFVMLSAYFLYRVFDTAYENFAIVCPHPNPPPSRGRKSNNLQINILPSLDGRGIGAGCAGLLQNFNEPFFGSLFLGFGLGVRLSYFPFIALWLSVLFYLAFQSIHLKTNVILYGLIGFISGICLWLFPQISYVGWHHFLHNGFLFSCGHFSDWGGSIITSGGLERVVCLVKSIWVYGLGGWWYDSSFLRLIPSSIMIISLLYFLTRCHYDRRSWFLGIYLIPYTLWVMFGQNVTNPRHIMPIIPVVLMLIAYGLCKVYEECDRVISVLLAVVFIVSISVISLKLVIRYHLNVPAPVQLIQFIQGHFDSNSTRLYCGEEKRFFDYYAPLWDVRKVRDAIGLNIDLQSSLSKPQNILLVQGTGEIEKFGPRCPLITKFQGNPYTDGVRGELLLYALTDF